MHTVAGAVCIYVLLGMMFSFAYAAIDTIDGRDFFVQTSHATLPNFLYFSFITQTTVGYGDYTAAGNLGHALASLEALIGQLYLVTVVAVLVSRIAGNGRSTPTPRRPRPPTSRPRTPRSDPTTGQRRAGFGAPSSLSSRLFWSST